MFLQTGLIKNGDFKKVKVKWKIMCSQDDEKGYGSKTTLQIVSSCLIKQSHNAELKFGDSGLWDNMRLNPVSFRHIPATS
jgi:hypothetical protein